MQTHSSLYFASVSRRVKIEAALLQFHGGEDCYVVRPNATVLLTRCGSMQTRCVSQRYLLSLCSTPNIFLDYTILNTSKNISAVLQMTFNVLCVIEF